MNKLSNRLTNHEVNRFMFHHPNIGMFLYIVGVPILLLLSLFILCYIVMFPISLLMGWI